MPAFRSSPWASLVSGAFLAVATAVFALGRVVIGQVRLAFGLAFELFFFLLLFGQFFLTLLVSVIGCCQSMLSVNQATVTSCGQCTAPR